VGQVRWSCNSQPGLIHYVPIVGCELTSLINGAIQRKQLIFPAEDLEIEDQFTTHTYTLRDGKIIYFKGNDHVIDAVRCAMLVREEGNLDPIGEETVSLKPVFTDPVFI
jgi:hypothetical protein